jgi:uncharacterized repeat protein (TIGR03806 family)
MRPALGLLACVLVAAVVTAAGCGGEIEITDEPAPDAPTCVRPSDYITNPPQRLSRYCILENHGGAIVPAAADVVPYDLNAPLFSDYALKTRLVWVPPGTTIKYDANSAFDMPLGSIVAKTFAFPKDLRAPNVDVRVFETRILVRGAHGWTAVPYVWNDAQDDATLATSRDTRTISFVDLAGAPRTASYLLPSAFDCHACHDSAAAIPQLIGPSARQLNRPFVYATGEENQLAHWTKLGILSGAPDPKDAPRLAAWSDAAGGSVTERARAYLEGNCAHCHNADGLSAKTGLFLRADETDPARLGVCKPTGDATSAGGLTYDIVPGDADHSVLAFRLASTDPHVMMPQIGRSVVHTEGLALVRQWIAGLSGACSSSSSGSQPPSDGGADAGADSSADAGKGDAGSGDDGDQHGDGDGHGRGH